MPFPLSSLAKAWCNLAALMLVLAGTTALTLGGVPELVPQLITDDQGRFITDDQDRVLSNEPDPTTVAAHRR